MLNHAFYLYKTYIAFWLITCEIIGIVNEVYHVAVFTFIYFFLLYIEIFFHAPLNRTF